MFDRALMKLRGIGGVMGALCVLALLQAAAVAGQAFALAYALATLCEGAGLEEAIPHLAGFFACFACGRVVAFAQETMMDSYARARAEELRARLLGRVFDAATMLASRVGAGVVAENATEGADQVQNYIRIVAPKTIGMAFVSLPLLVCAFAVDWVSGLILAVAFPVIMFFMVLLGKQARARAERQYTAYQRLSNRFADTMRGLAAIIDAGAGCVEEEAAFAYSEKLRRATVRTLATATLSSAVLDLIATMGVAAVAMMLAFRLMDGTVVLSTALVSLLLAPEFFAPVRAFASDFHASLDGRNALAAVLQMTEVPKGILPSGTSEVPKGILPSGTSPQPGETSRHEASLDAFAQGRGGRAESSARISRSPVVPSSLRGGGEGAVMFGGVSFAYEGAEGEALSDISLEIPAGQRVAVIGPSGAGKSTLAGLAAGFLKPTVGEVRTAGAVHYVPQSPYVFRASILENVRLYSPSASEEQVWQALETVGMAEFARALPEGVDTLVGDGGRGLSGGQAHRIALARILLDSSARILVFDEPTAHLDVETEREIKQKMLACMEGKTVLFATHRLHWCADMDRVVTLEGGRIAADEKARDESLDSHSTHFRESACDKGGSCENESNDCQATHLPESVCKDESADFAPSRGLPAWVRGYAAEHRSSLAGALVLGTVASVCAALLMFTSGYLIVATAQPATTLFSVMVPVAFVQLFGFGRPVAHYLERLLSHDWVLKVTSALRRDLMHAAVERQGDPGRSHAVGDYLAALGDDIAHAQNLYLRVMFPAIIAIALVVCAGVLFAFFSVPFALAMFAALAVVAAGLPALCRAMTWESVASVKTRKGREHSRLADDVFGAVDWVLAGRGGEAASRCASRLADIAADEARIRLVTRAFSLTSALLVAAIACAVAVWAAGAFAPNTPDARWTVAFVLGAFALVEPLVPLPVSYADAQNHAEAIGNLDGFLGDTGQGNAQPPVSEATALGECPFAESDFAIEVESVSYRYPNDRECVLDGISLAVPRGQHVAILGPSGSGKSTLARVVRAALSPDAGEVRLFGVPAEACAERMAHTIGYLGQTPYLFNRTLRENLLLAAPDPSAVSDTALEATVARVGLASKLASLPDGLDTVVGETGAGFSGGEAHRLALARVLVAEAPIVMVDEPFSALDPETEHALLDTLLAACEEKTLVVITHHLAQIDRFDRVVFIEGGRVAIDDAPAKLAVENARFRELLAFDR